MKRILSASFLLLHTLSMSLLGQEMHRIHTSGLPMGEIGQTRLAQGGPVRGYYQPVQFHGPAGSQISLAVDAQFGGAKSLPAKSGLLVGEPYRLRITGIPFHAGEAVFPTIELIDRTYPPIGQALDYPIVVEITQDDLETALSGKYVTKVVYLENPQTSLPVKSDPQSPLSWDVQPGVDPLSIANTLGRPVAILRIGGRAPAGSGPINPSFFLGCPPWIGVEHDENGHVLLTHHSIPKPVQISAYPPVHTSASVVSGGQVPKSSASGNFHRFQYNKMPSQPSFPLPVGMPPNTGQGVYR
ncbi:MAG TPA: hypothetical protein DEB39_06820 [Planctomycetaceae bacterium]|nr:hypothetical protein [Planctomycetaceae bacterium]